MKVRKSIWLLLIATLAIVGIAMLFVDTIPPHSMTDLSMQMCKRRVLRFAREHGKLPSSLSETKPIEGYHSSMKDGWGVVLDYGFDSNGVVTLRSLGKDRAAGGIVNDVDMIGTFPSKEADGSWSGEFVEWTQDPFDAVRKKPNLTSDGLHQPAVISGCQTQTAGFDVDRAEQQIAKAMPHTLAHAEDYDCDRAEREIAKAISSGQYEAADRLIDEENSELAGGLFADVRDLRRALVKVKLGRFPEALHIVEDVLSSYPEGPHRATALALRKWLVERQDSTHNKETEPGADPLLPGQEPRGRIAEGVEQ